MTHPGSSRVFFPLETRPARDTPAGLRSWDASLIRDSESGCIRERDLKFRSLLFEATQNIYSTPAVGGQPDFNPNNRPSLFTLSR